MELRPDKFLDALPRIAAVVNTAAILSGCGVMLAQIGNMDEAAMFARMCQQVLTGAGLVASCMDLVVVASVPDIYRGLLRTNALDAGRPARVASLGTMVVALALNHAL